MNISPSLAAQKIPDSLYSRKRSKVLLSPPPDWTSTSPSPSPPSLLPNVKNSYIQDDLNGIRHLLHTWSCITLKQFLYSDLPPYSLTTYSLPLLNSQFSTLTKVSFPSLLSLPTKSLMSHLLLKLYQMQNSSLSKKSGPRQEILSCLMLIESRRRNSLYQTSSNLESCHDSPSTRTRNKNFNKTKSNPSTKSSFLPSSPSSEDLTLKFENCLCSLKFQVKFGSHYYFAVSYHFFIIKKVFEGSLFQSMNRLRERNRKKGRKKRKGGSLISIPFSLQVGFNLIQFGLNSLYFNARTTF